jgi:hypothetical protein
MMKPLLYIIPPAIAKRAALFLSLLLLSSIAFSQALPTTTPSGKPSVHKTFKKKRKSKVLAESLEPDTTAVDTADDDYKAANVGKVTAPAIDMKAFGIKAEQKTSQLTDYIGIISSNKTSRDLATKSIDQACLLFSSATDQVEVSSIHSKEKNKYPIRAYLNRLQLKCGQYDAIKIEYAKVGYASQFKKGTDGNYYGVVTLVQTFKGYIDGKAVYADVTKKNITVVAKKYEKETEGHAVDSWDVYLSDIGVVETKSLKKN